jgi:hypothetical protein
VAVRNYTIAHLHQAIIIPISCATAAHCFLGIYVMRI